MVSPMSGNVTTTPVSYRRRSVVRTGRRALCGLIVLLSVGACTPELVVVLDEATAEAYGGRSELRSVARSTSGLTSRIIIESAGDEPQDAVELAAADYPRSRIAIPALLSDVLQVLPPDALESMVVLGGEAHDTSTADGVPTPENSHTEPARIYFNDEAAVRSAAVWIAQRIRGDESEVLLFAGENREPINLFLETMQGEMQDDLAESGVVEEISPRQVTSDTQARRRVEAFAEDGGRIVVSGAGDRQSALRAGSEENGLLFVSLQPRLVASAAESLSDTDRQLLIVRPFQRLLEHAPAAGAGENIEVDSELHGD